MDNKYSGLEVAVIGLSARFPGAGDKKAYWDNLRNGIESVRHFSREELLQKGIEQSLVDSEDYVKAAAVLDNPQYFDAAFFNYLNSEARHLDPQIRLLHETVWEALEDSGCDPDTSKGIIGLYAGADENPMWKVYSNLMENYGGLSNYYINHLNNRDYIASLLAYKLNLKGPVFFVHSACSTSLLAIHLACRGILTGECDIAIAGGAHLNAHLKGGYLYQEGMILSPDGHCRPFDNTSKGTVASEGSGVVVLKKLSAALQDGDHIYAIVKGSAVNNDGGRKLGYTAPSVEGQVECAKKALYMARVDPVTVSYIEAHGTGTSLGDPIEVEALNLAYQLPTGVRCPIGSVKSNIGHADAAAGAAGFIKMVLALKNREIPPSINYSHPNEKIDFERSAFYVNDKLVNWETRGITPLRGGINSFGIGGTNVHMILEEAPRQMSDEDDKESVFVFSAKTSGALFAYLQKFNRRLSERGGHNLADVAYSLATGRKAFPWRVSFPFKEVGELQNKLSSLVSDEYGSVYAGRSRKLVFMFPGQGTQYVNMGKEMYEKQAFFRKEVDMGFSLLNTFYLDDFKKIVFFPEALADINNTRYAQPLLFIFEYAMASYLIHLGVCPDYMIGHSVGEYVAAVVSGVLSFEDGLRLLAERGRLMGKLPRGAMLSVGLSFEKAQAVLVRDISIAAVNGPEQVVFSGPEESIKALGEVLTQMQIVNVRLRTSHAFHSGMMDEILDPYRDILRDIRFKKPEIPFISNLTGELIRPEEAMSVEYWVKHLKETVYFTNGVQKLGELNANTFIEVGPGKSLTALLKQNLPGSLEYISVHTMRHPSDKTGDWMSFVGAVGVLWSHGININWERYFEGQSRLKVPLPTYAFEKVAYQVEVSDINSIHQTGLEVLTPKSATVKDAFYFPSWKKSFLLSDGDSAVSNYLVFADAAGFANDVCKDLASGTSGITVVTPGIHFAKISDNNYQINPLDKNDYLRLLTELKKDNLLPGKIIYAWLLDPVETNSGHFSVDNSSFGFFSIHYIIRSLDLIDAVDQLQLYVMTQNLHCVQGTERTNIHHATVLGLLKVVCQEYPGIFAANLDMSGSLIDKGLQRQIASEIKRNMSDKVVVIGSGARWIPHYEPLSIPDREEDVSSIRENGVYLVTGGLGELGNLLAEYLLGRYHAKLIIVGRTELFEAGQVKNPDFFSDTQMASRIKRLVRLSSIGEVRYVCHDMKDSVGFNRVIAEVEKDLGSINGIIHAAGVLDPDKFNHSNQIREHDARVVFSPKIDGLSTLYNCFKRVDLDFVWLASSLGAILGGLGFSAYSAANIFMDAFVNRYGDELNNWISVNLDNIILKNDKRTAVGSVINEAELLELFEITVSLTGMRQVVVAKGDFRKRLERYVDVNRSQDDSAAATPSVKARRNSIGVTFVDPVTDTEIRLAEIWSDFFSLDKVGASDDFFELGGDSLKAMAILKLIHKRFNIELNLSELFETSKINQLAEKIDSLIWVNTKDSYMDKSIVI